MVRYRPPIGSTTRARKLRNRPTEAEKVVWNLLRTNFPQAHFRRQVPIRNCFADFASHRLRLVIEVDGGQHGGKRDEERTRLIEAEGYSVVRFWNHDVLANDEGVATVIAAALADRHPHQPPPSRGRL